MRKISQFVFFLIMIGSIGLNLRNLFTQSILLDEAQSIWVSTKSVPDIIKTDAQDVNIPLYSLLLHFWMQLIGTDIVMARFLSLIFYVATIPVLFILIKENTTSDTAILGVALFLLSPFMVWYSQEARTYSLLTLITTMNHLFFLHFFKSRGRSGKLGYFLTALIGMYTHYFFTFLLVAQALFLFYYFIRRAKQNTPATPTRSRFVVAIFVIGLTLIALFVPWILYVYRLGLAAYTQPLIPAPTSFSLLQIYLNFLLGFQNQSIQSLVISLWPLFLMALFFIFTRKLRLGLERADYFLLVSFLPVLLVYIVSFIKPIFLPRYLIFVIPSLFTLIAWILMNFGSRILSFLTVLTMLLMLISLNFQDSSQATPVKEDYRDVVLFLDTNATSHDIVAVTAPFTIYPIEYYYDGLARIDTIPHWNRYVQGPIPSFSLIGLQQQMNQYLSIYTRLFVVLSYDQGYQAAIISYLDHHYQLLAKYNYASNIQLRVYQLRYDLPLSLSQ